MSKTLYTNIKEGFLDTQNLDSFKKGAKGQQEWLGEGGGVKTVELPLLGNSETYIGYFMNNHTVAVDLTAVKAMKSGSADTATATLSNLDAEGGAANPLSGSNINLHALTNDAAPASQTLSSTAANIRVPAGGRVRITVATGVSGTLAGGLLQFYYEPIA